MAATLALVTPAGCGGDGEESTSAGRGDHGCRPKRAPAAPASWVTLRDARTGFSVQAPRGFRLGVQKGVYVLRQGERTITFSRTVTDARPAAYGDALLRQIGGKVVSRQAGDDALAAAVDGDAGRETFVIRRAGDAP